MREGMGEGWPQAPSPLPWPSPSPPNRASVPQLGRWARQALTGSGPLVGSVPSTRRCLSGTHRLQRGARRSRQGWREGEGGWRLGGARGGLGGTGTWDVGAGSRAGLGVCEDVLAASRCPLTEQLLCTPPLGAWLLEAGDLGQGLCTEPATPGLTRKLPELGQARCGLEKVGLSPEWPPVVPATALEGIWASSPTGCGRGWVPSSVARAARLPCEQQRGWPPPGGGVWGGRGRRRGHPSGPWGLSSEVGRRPARQGLWQRGGAMGSERWGRARG